MKPFIQFSEQAKRASESGHYAEGARLCRKAIELLPFGDVEGRVLYLVSAAQAHLDARNYAEAIDTVDAQSR
jgi:hypothetical protein